MTPSSSSAFNTTLMESIRLLVGAHIAIFTRHQRQIFGNQIVGTELLHEIIRLVTEADHAIVVTVRQFVHSLLQVFDDNHFCTRLCQCILHRTGVHDSDGLVLHITQAHKVCLPFATDNLIVKSEDGTRIIRQILSIRRIDHHRQIHTAVQHVVGDILPGVRPNIAGYSHALHQDFRKLYVKSVRQTFSLTYSNGG